MTSEFGGTSQDEVNQEAICTFKEERTSLRQDLCNLNRDEV